MDTSVLEGIGLSKGEVSIFVKLVELGESKAGTIISKSGVQSSGVYNAINALIDKGLVSFIMKNRIKYYKAADPKTILDYIEAKKREYLKLLPELQFRQKKEIEDGTEFFKGYNGIKTLVFELMTYAKKGDIYRYIAPEAKYYRISTDKVYSAEKQIRKEIHLRTRGLYHISAKHLTRPTKTSIKKYTEFILPPNTLILNNKVAIISWEGEPFGILIHSEKIYKTYVDFFDNLWSKAKD
jgi:sugar-specific transcriptional regulator TrmB